MSKISSLTLPIRRRGQAVLLLTTVTAAMTLACSLIATESSKPPAPTAQPSTQQPTPTRQPALTPTVVPVIPAPAPPQQNQQSQEQPAPTPTVEPVAIATAFESTAIRFDYGNEWRLSSKTDDSVVFTLKENPGEVMLSVQWMEGVDSNLDQFASQFEEKLRLYAQEVEVLEDTSIGGTNARRFASLVGTGDSRSVAMNVIFQSGQRFYLATFAASPENFGEHAGKAMGLIEGFTLP